MLSSLFGISPEFSSPTFTLSYCIQRNTTTKNPAYGRHRIFRPMRIEAPIFFFWKIIQSGRTPCFQGSTSWSTNAQVHQSNNSHAWALQGCNLEKLLVFKALRVGQQVHQSTSRTPSMDGRYMYVIQNNSLFLGRLIQNRTSC